MDSFDFSAIPGFSRLFTDFISSAPALLARFPANTPEGVDPEAVKKRLERSYDRPLLAEVARETMGDIELHPAQQEALGKLLRDNTSVVITGQQAGLFGGPLYTLLKAQSAVALAQTVSQSTDSDCIPVFWVEDNDHDFAEIAQATVFNRDYQLQHMAIAEVAAEERTPVGSRSWQGTDTALDELFAALPSTGFTGELSEFVRNAYAPGSTITRSFVHMLNAVLAPTGILFVSAFALQQRGVFAPVLRREIDEPGASHAVLERASEELVQAGYHVQAQPLMVNCMVLLAGRRYRVQPEGSDFRVGDRVLSAGELRALIETSPEILSPTVLTRPLMQDAVFPTAAYVAGPGEIAYAAQLKELYELYDISIPAFLPRHSATLTEHKFKTFLADQSFVFTDVLRTYEQVEKHFMESIRDEKVQGVFDSASSRLKEIFTELEAVVAAVDATLGASAGRALALSEQQLEQLAGKVQKARKRQEESALVKLRQAHSFLFPEHTLQERVVNWLYYWNRYGLGSLQQTLDSVVRHSVRRHYVVVIDPRTGGEKAAATPETIV
jgi:bacillithiol biosynthesis cysteine-adding enzyme BshC